MDTRIHPQTWKSELIESSHSTSKFYLQPAVWVNCRDAFQSPERSGARALG